jgi:hypothetical protein
MWMVNIALGIDMNYLLRFYISNLQNMKLHVKYNYTEAKNWHRILFKPYSKNIFIQAISTETIFSLQKIPRSYI